MFDYGVVAQEIQDFRNRGFEVGVIGKTVLRQPIPYIKIGNGGARIIITGGIHAREYITTLLVLKLASIAEKQYPKGTIYFIPAVNPDGIRLCTEGLSFFKALLTNPSQSSLSSAELVKIAENLISYNRNDDFRLWKANANGVDLNVNFDAE